MAITNDPEFHSLPESKPGAPEYAPPAAPEPADEYAAGREFPELPPEYAPPGGDKNTEGPRRTFSWARLTALLAAYGASVAILTTTLPSGWTPFAESPGQSAAEETEEETEEESGRSGRRGGRRRTQASEDTGGDSTDEAGTSEAGTGTETEEASGEAVHDAVFWKSFLADNPYWKQEGENIYARFRADGTGWFTDGTTYHPLSWYVTNVDWSDDDVLSMRTSYIHWVESDPTDYPDGPLGSLTEIAFSGTEDAPVLMIPVTLPEQEGVPTDQKPFRPVASVPGDHSAVEELIGLSESEILERYPLWELRPEDRPYSMITEFRFEKSDGQGPPYFTGTAHLGNVSRLESYERGTDKDLTMPYMNRITVGPIDYVTEDGYHEQDSSFTYSVFFQITGDGVRLLFTNMSDERRVGVLYPAGD